MGGGACSGLVRREGPTVIARLLSQRPHAACDSCCIQRVLGGVCSVVKCRSCWQGQTCPSEEEKEDGVAAPLNLMLAETDMSQGGGEGGWCCCTPEPNVVLTAYEVTPVTHLLLISIPSRITA